MHRRYSRIITLSLIIVLNGIFFGLLDPAKVPSPLLFVGFAVLAVDLACLWYGVLWASRQVFSYPRRSLRRPVFLTALVSVLLLALQSIGQLTVKDIVAIIAFAAVIWFYQSYYRSKQA